MVWADVVILIDCPQSCMPHPVEGLLEVFKDMEEVLLVLEIFLDIAGWKSALWCSFLSDACLFFSDDLRLWLQSVPHDLQHDFSGTATSCLYWEVWWLRTLSTGLAFLLSARSCYKLSWERWLHLLHLLSPVLLGFCRLQLTSLSSMIVLQPPFLCKGWGGRPLWVSGDKLVLMDLHWPCDCTAESSILSIVLVSAVLLCDTFLNDLW